MAATSVRNLIVVAGIGNGSGTGASTAKVFAKQGYDVALISRSSQHLEKTASSIRAATPNVSVAHFALASYEPSEIEAAFASIKATFSTSILRVAVFNAASRVVKPFLSLTADEIKDSTDVNLRASFAFAQLAVRQFKENDIDAQGRRGVLIFTGATAAWRGKPETALFAAGKHGLRALSQALNKEFGKDNIHVAHVVVDGAILTDILRSRKNSVEWEQNEDVRLDPDAIAETFWHIANQHRSAWSWETDLRPSHETYGYEFDGNFTRPSRL